MARRKEFLLDARAQRRTWRRRRSSSAAANTHTMRYVSGYSRTVTFSAYHLAERSRRRGLSPWQSMNRVKEFPTGARGHERATGDDVEQTKGKAPDSEVI